MKLKGKTGGPCHCHGQSGVGVEGSGWDSDAAGEDANDLVTAVSMAMEAAEQKCLSDAAAGDDTNEPGAH